MLTNDQGQCYIGSTTEPLAIRFSKHKNAYKRYTNGLPVSSCSAFEVFDGCAENETPQIVSLEEVIFDSRRELLRREGHHIRQNAATCVNKAVAGRTKLEHYRDNAEQIKQKSRERYHARRQQIRLLALGLI